MRDERIPSRSAWWDDVLPILENHSNRPAGESRIAPAQTRILSNPEIPSAPVSTVRRLCEPWKWR